METPTPFLAQCTLPSGIRLVKVSYAPKTVRVRTDCPDLQLWWVRRGGWTVEKSGTVAQLGGGNASVHAPREPCRQRVGPQAIDVLSVQVPAASLPSERALLSEGRDACLARIHALLGKPPEPLLLEEAVASLFSAIPERQAPHWLKMVQEALHAHFTESPSLSALAQLAQVHEVHLATTFRAHLGCTMGEYVRRLRLDAALHRLCHSTDDIATIAQATGFYDHAHLTRLFRAQIGVSPSAFRKS